MHKKAIIFVGLLIILITSGIIFVYQEDRPFNINLLEENVQPAIGYGIMITEENLDSIANDHYYVSLDMSEELHLTETLTKLMEKDEERTIQLIQRLDGNINADELEKGIADIIKNLQGEKHQILLSLIPEEDITQETYNTLYTKVRDKLQIERENPVELVWYPKTKSNLSGMPKDATWVGVLIKNTEDVDLLSALYERFTLKSIVINECIADTYEGDIKNGTRAMNYLYYTVASKYPDIKLIYNINTKMHKDFSYQKYYQQFLSQPWITASKVEPSPNNTGAYYREIQSYPKVSGTVYINLETNIDDPVGYVEYKWNNLNLNQSMTRPYLLTVDTTQLHNGINRLSVIRYDTGGSVIDKRIVDVEVDNRSSVSDRAARMGDFYPASQKVAYSRPYIPVLMYHKFADQVSPDDHSMTVSTANFEDQMKTLMDEGYTPITFYDLKSYLDGTGGLPPKPVIITADDGYICNYEIAYPVLKKYAAPATFFITTEFVGTSTSSDHFTWEQAKEMEESGLIDIQSHTHSHARLNELSEEDVKYQVSMSFGIIERELGKRDVQVVSYPEFRNNRKTRKWLAELGVDLQITNLANHRSKTMYENVQRIHVTNDMTGKDLVEKLKELTQ